MSILVVRHGLSEANNRENVGSLAFASESAPLMEQGRGQAMLLGVELAITHGIIAANTAVATSELQRTQETAKIAGFNTISTYPSLNEVIHGMELPDLRKLLDDRKLPKAAIEAANKILENPPTERIWITHGLVIAGLCQVLGVSPGDRLIPRFCEIRELPI